MNNLNKFFMGFAALAMLASCSNDEPNSGNGNLNGEAGDQVYMNVNIRAVNPSRAAQTPDNDKGYEYGSDEEHAVNDAQFFFFDENGVFVSKGSFWKGGNDGGTNANIEYFGNNVLVVDKSDKKGSPRYMLTVLNAPDFQPKSTLRLTAESLDEDYGNVIGNTGYFVMSTSSWFIKSKTNKNHVDFDDNNNPFYYATRLDDADFYLSASDAQANGAAVDVYVERLAAKVQVTVDMGEDQEFETLKDGTVIYKLTSTVAGELNNGATGEGAATTAVYVEFKGWDLNATAVQSYLSKQLSGDWKTTVPFTDWDKYADDDFRTFWGMSTVYGSTPAEGTLSYIDGSYNLKKEFTTTSVAYCNENTNTPAGIIVTNNAGQSVVNTRAVTHVVLRARACDREGNDLDMVRYNGILRTRTAFYDYLLNSIDMGTNKNLDFWVFIGKDGDDKNWIENYKQIDNSCLDLVSTGDGVLGSVKAVANFASDAVIYHHVEKDVPVLDAEGNETKDEEGNVITEKKTVIEAYESVEAAAAALNELLAPMFTATNRATSYNGGEMVYYVPIKHLNTVVNAEGYYGVLRNHWYKLEINSVDKVGNGVFNPGDEENPGETLDPGTPEEPLYYVGARINVLSWKVVNQGVAL